MSVIWYIPNLVGYLRILFTLIAAFLIFYHPVIGMGFGFISQILDAADGTLARHFNQCSALGAILDYTIDRLFVACWMIVLTVLFPHLWPLFMFILVFDLVSHLFHMYASLHQGKKSHKQKDKHQGILLQYYYSDHRLFMFLVCLFHDFWILAMISYHYFPNNYTLIAVVLFTPFLVFKGYIHLAQLFSATQSLVQLHILYQSDLKTLD